MLGSRSVGEEEEEEEEQESKKEKEPFIYLVHDGPACQVEASNAAEAPDTAREAPLSLLYMAGTQAG